MSFLFTFSLPRLPFNNPFAAQDDNEHDQVQGQRPQAVNHDADKVPRSISSSNRDWYRQRDSLSSSKYSEQAHNNLHSRGHYEEPMAESYFDNPRKRKKTESFNDNIVPLNDFTQFQPPRPRPRESRNASGNRRSRPVQFEYRDVPEEYSDDAEEHRRGTKRRKIGIAETLISTVVSVAIVSTAVGYTAYRLWKDKGKITGTDEEGTDDKTGLTNAHTPRRNAIDGYHPESLISSPPPPYHAEQEDVEHDEDLYSQRRVPERRRYQPEQYYNRSAGRPPMSQVHRVLGTSVEDGEKKRTTRDEEQFSSQTWLRDSWTKERLQKPHIQHNAEEDEEDMGVEDHVGTEELEAGRKRLEQQMDSMSSRLQKLIADGNRALYASLPVEGEL